MKWSEFVAAVLVDLPVDNERIGIATGNPNYLGQQLLYCAIKIQQIIPFYQTGHETIYGANDLVVQGMASCGSIPQTDQCRPVDAYFKTVGEQCVSHPFLPYSWGNRYDLVCGKPCNRFYMAIDPQGKQFTCFPMVMENHQILLRWDGVKLAFEDDDETPFDMGCVEATGLYVKAKIARMVDHDLAEHASYMGEHRTRISLLYADSKDRIRLSNIAANLQTNGGTDCANRFTFCSTCANPTGEVAKENTTEFVAFGDSSDLGYQLATLRVSALVRELEPDFVMHMGDCNYPDGDPLNIQENLIVPYGLYIPKNFFLAFGNHDIEVDGGAALEALLARQAALNDGKTYYSYIPDGDFCRLFVLDTNAVDPAEQAAWLEAALAESSMWNIVVMHKSPYTSDEIHAPGDVAWRLPFKDWGADLVLSAHGHNYERFQVDGLFYIVCGLGGAALRGFVDPPTDGSQFRYNTLHGTVYVTARQQRLQVTLYNISGTVIDGVALDVAQVFA